MLYTASYFEPKHHHGRKLSISKSVPKGFKVDGSLSFLVPSSQLLTDWKVGQISEDEYTQRYRVQIKQSWSDVTTWLNNLAPQPQTTLLCWERQGEFCHRNLVARLVEKYRPDCFGGRDVARVEMEKCAHCGSELCPGLDASFCRSCKIWINHWRDGGSNE